MRARPIRGLRWYIGGLLFASTVINYIDRQTLNVLAPYLKTEFSWTNTDFALLVVAFRAAYAPGQTIVGRVLDRLGTRDGLSLGVGVYSAAAVLTSLATGLSTFCGFASCWGREKPQIGQARRRPCPRRLLIHAVVGDQRTIAPRRPLGCREEPGATSVVAQSCQGRRMPPRKNRRAIALGVRVS
jgi:MFS family permease